MAADAGELFDAGEIPDAGELPDAGEVPDAGEGEADAGEAEPDAGVENCEPAPAWYADPDGDGYGDPDDFIESCTQPDGYAPVAEAAEALELDHESLSLPVGTGARVVAHLAFNSGRSEDVSGLVEWSSDAPTIVRVGNGTQAGGLMDALALGQAVVRASYGDFEASVTVDATAAVVRDLRVTPPQATARLGDDRGVRFKAIATYTDGSVVDVTEEADWSTQDFHIGSVGNVSIAEWTESETDPDAEPIGYDPKGLFWLSGFNYHVDPPEPLTTGTATVTATLDGVVATASLLVTDATLENIGIDAVSPILLGTTVALAASGFYDSGLYRVLTTEVEWTSSHPEVVAISTTEEGVFATALGPGSATLMACLGEVCGDRLVEVNARVLTEVRIVADSTDVLLGVKTRMKAIAVFADGLQQDVTSISTMTWDFAEPDLVEVEFEGTRGMSVYDGVFRNAYTVRGLREGLLTVTATLATSHTTSMSGHAFFEVRAPQLVSLEVTPSSVSLPFSDVTNLRALGTFEDGMVRDVSSQTMWLSDDPAVALPIALDATGIRISGLHGGQTQIVARAGAVSATATVEVLDDIASIELLPVHPGTLDPYEPPFRTGTFVQFIPRATLASGAVRDLPVEGFQWKVPVSYEGDAAYFALKSVGPGLFRVTRELAADIVATHVLYDGRTYSASYLVNAELDAPYELVVDPPNPAAAWDGIERVNKQYFKIYVRKQSGRLEDVTDQALEVRITPRAGELVYGDNPGKVASPGEVVESTYWELVELAPGFETDRARFPNVSHVKNTRETTAVRRFDAPRNLRGLFDVRFRHAGLSRTVPMALYPTNWSISLDPDFEFAPSLYETFADHEPERLVVRTMDDLLIKDLDPKYGAALRMMEERAVARAATVDAASIEADYRSHPGTAGLSEQEKQKVLEMLRAAIALPRVRERVALLVEMQLLLAKPKASRTPDENLVVAWLGKTVRDARVASAKAVLREYEKWAENPWTYVPPPGVDYLRPPQETNLASLFDNPQPPNLLRLAQAGISPSLVAGTASAPLETIVCATVTAGALASASAIAVGMAIMAETILPYTLQAAGTTLGAATVAGPAIIITATVILSIHSVHVVQREMLPNRLAEIVAAAEAEAVPSADVLVAQPDGLKTIMGALLTRMY